MLLLSLLANVALLVNAQVRRASPADVQKRSGAIAEIKSQPDVRAPGSAPAQPASAPLEGFASRFALAFKASTLGLGADVGVRVVRPLNIRVGFGTFHYTADLKHDGTSYRGSLRLRSLQTMVDWFPLAGSFHVTPGVIFRNSNRVTAIAAPPLGQIQTSGDIAYISDPQNPLKGKALSGVRSIAPMLTAGFGNLAPRKHHFVYSVDFGVVYQGHPKSNFTLQGGACDPTGTFCSKIGDDVDTRRQVAAAEDDLNKSVSFMRFYPVASIEFGYRF